MDEWPLVILVCLLAWMGVKLTQSACTLVLNDQEFRIEKHSRFKFLPKDVIQHSWEDFAYQAGGIFSYKFRLYKIAITLKDGRSFSFFSGTSEQDKKIAQRIHDDIDQRVEKYHLNKKSGV